MKRMTASLLAGFAVIFAAQSYASAGFVPWTYNWSRAPLAVSANAPGTGGLTLTDEPINHAVGSSDIVATNIRSFSSAPRTNPDLFTNKPYTLTLFLQDDGSGQHANLVFTGAFSGNLSAVSANITNAFTGNTSQTVTLGGHKYIVQIGPYAPPGPPTASNAGSISAHVFVDQVPDQPPGGGGGNGGGGTGNGGGGPHDAPEPSTLLLAAFGLSGLSAGAWRKIFSRI